jgi:hypothetical protein
VKGNLIYNIDRSPLRFHRASTNVVESNLLYVSGKEIPPVRYNNTPEEMILLKTNEVILQSAKRLESSKDQP